MCYISADLHRTTDQVYRAVLDIDVTLDIECSAIQDNCTVFKIKIPPYGQGFTCKVKCLAAFDIIVSIGQLILRKCRILRHRLIGQLITYLIAFVSVFLQLFFGNGTRSWFPRSALNISCLFHCLQIPVVGFVMGKLNIRVNILFELIQLFQYFNKSCRTFFAFCFSNKIVVKSTSNPAFLQTSNISNSIIHADTEGIKIHICCLDEFFSIAVGRIIFITVLIGCDKFFQLFVKGVDLVH